MKVGVVGDLAGRGGEWRAGVIGHIARCTAMYVPGTDQTSWCAHQWFDMTCCIQT